MPIFDYTCVLLTLTTYRKNVSLVSAQPMLSVYDMVLDIRFNSQDFGFIRQVMCVYIVKGKLVAHITPKLGIRLQDKSSTYAK